MNNKKAQITVDFKPTARGDRGIKVENPKVKSINLN
jgi:hypothetical protein